jgi:hypothetical protein
MANRHVRAMRLGALVPIGVVLVLVASATAGTPSSYTFKGNVSAQNDRWDWHQVKVSAGSTVSVRLNWWSESANLQVVVFGPDGNEVAAARDGSVRPKDLSFIATADGSYNAAVRAESGRSGYKLQVDITPNDPPTATPDSASLVQGTSVSVDPLANDSDPNGDTLMLKSVGTPSDGTVVQGTAGNVTYKPKSGFSGSDSFGYTVCDTRTPDQCSSSRVDVSVTSLVSTSDSGLRWAPPTLTDPITISLAATGDVGLNLDNSRDYIIKYPDVRRVGELRLVGGRNIVIVGGASTIGPHTGTGVRNIQISDKAGVMDGRVVHIEGLDIDGSGGGEADGIGIGAPSAIVQIENVRITGLIGHLSGTHADVIQTWGGMKALRLYDVTGASPYNNLYLRRENSPLGPAIGAVTLDHVNVFGYTNPTDWDVSSTLRGVAIGTQPADTDCTDKGQCGPPNPDSATNCDLTAPVVLNDFYASPPVGKLQRFMWPTEYMTVAGCPSALSADGGSADWPALRGQVSGVMHLGPPPGGDFVPAGSVGVGYVSPGYQPAG